MKLVGWLMIPAGVASLVIAFVDGFAARVAGSGHASCQNYGDACSTGDIRITFGILGPVLLLLGLILLVAGTSGPDATAAKKRPLAATSTAGAAVSAATPAAEPSPRRAEDPLDRLEKLRQLREAGALSADEFEQAKARLLSDL